MFKAAFPYAQQEDEANEKEHIKTLPATSTEEVAGNVWIHPEEGRHIHIHLTCCREYCRERALE